MNINIWLIKIDMLSFFTDLIVSQNSEFVEISTSLIKLKQENLTER